MRGRSMRRRPLRQRSKLPEVVVAFARLCERAAAAGLRVDLEFLPWTIVPDLRTALQIAREADQANAGVMLDCWHFYRGGSDVDADRRSLEG